MGAAARLLRSPVTVYGPLHTAKTKCGTYQALDMRVAATGPNEICIPTPPIGFGTVVNRRAAFSRRMPSSGPLTCGSGSGNNPPSRERPRYDVPNRPIRE